MRPEIEFALWFGGFALMCGFFLGYVVKRGVDDIKVAKAYGKGVARGYLSASGLTTPEQRYYQHTQPDQIEPIAKRMQ